MLYHIKFSRCEKDCPWLLAIRNAIDLFDFLDGAVFLQVYASNDQIMVMVSAICGPCQVLHVDKFKETKRSQVVSSDSRLHPIFFCRFVSDPLMFPFALLVDDELKL